MKKLWILLALIGLLYACEVDSTDDSESYTIDTTDWDWTDATHGDDVDPNYDIVFPGESDGTNAEVLEFHIAFEEEDWYEMQIDLADNIDKVNNEDYDYTPVWVPCEFYYDYDDDEVLTEWYKVGIRYKGNSSLASAYESGIDKLSFKLDFDEFEDDYSDIENQRFFGFKQLNLNNNFDDESFLREKVGSDLFREFGLVSANTTLCVIYLDSGDGDGEQYYGIYTLVEEVDDTVVEDQLDEFFMGNLYKPDGDSAQFSGNYTWDEDEMEVKNNEDDCDYVDVYSLYELMANYDNYDTKSTWMTELEDVLDVDTFLQWYASNTIIQNWDTYGNMSHNYYLYNYSDSDANTSLLTWIPWDNNEAFLEGSGEKAPVSLNYENFTDDDEWPLIGYILDQTTYQDTYNTYVASFVTKATGETKSIYFDETVMTTLYETYEALLEGWADLEEDGYSFLNNSSDFSDAIDTLIDHVEERNLEVYSYISSL